MVKKIVLSFASVLMCVAFAVAQNQQVTGTVTDAAGAPVIGASVTVDGTSIGTSTDADGHFVLSAPVNGTITVSFIGYADVQTPIAGKTNLSVVMQEDTKGIEDVIVIAFGEAKREAFTGSATVLKSEDITKSQTTNVLDALNGRVAGVQMTTSTGQPGSAGSSSILIRGVGSINSGKSPLIVLDGMPYDGDINTIAPSDIESMTVLKDAASNALYGARGANGVIMITTKRAKSRDAVVNVDVKVGVNQRAVNDYDYITDPAQYYEQHYKALYNKNIADGLTKSAAHAKAVENLTGKSEAGGLVYNVFTVPDGQSLIGMNGKINPNATLGRKAVYNGEDYWLTPDNWINEVYMEGVRQEYNVNASGTLDRANFYASFGYLNNQGIVDKTNYERYTARLRADYQVKKWLKIGANAAYTHYTSQTTDTSDQGDGSTGSSGNVFAYTSRIAPIYPLYVRNGDGSIKRDQYGHIVYDYGTATRNGSNAGLERPFLTGTNAYGDHQYGEDSYRGNTASLNGFATVNFYKDLKFTLNGGIYLDNTSYRSISDMNYSQSAPSGGSISRSMSTVWAYNLQQLLEYNKTFKKNTIDIMIGHENYYRSSNSVGGYKTGLFSEYVSELPGAIKTVSATSGMSEYNNEGYFIRAQYDYDNRIFLSASYRCDASSRFHPDHRWGHFYSFGAAWLINRESWFNASWVDLLKIKASYGSQGNDGIGDYLYADLYSISDDGAGNWSSPFYRKGNPNITWETNSNTNVGFEFSFFGDRLMGDVEYFYRKTTDMLSFVPVPPSMGYTGYYKNIGDMVNQGVEFELTGVLLKKKNVYWDINLNLSYVKNKIVRLDEYRKGSQPAYDLNGNAYEGYASGSVFYGEGLPIYSQYEKAYAGVDENTGEPLFWRRDEDTGEYYTTSDYSNADHFIHKTSLPDVYGGFGTSLNIYGVDISVNFAYQVGGTVYDGGYAASMASPTSGNTGNAYHKDLFKSWTPENVHTNVPRFQYDDQYNGSSCDRFLTDASYLSLQNINVGYTFPQKWMSKIGVSKLRIYFAAENVYLWSRRKGLDPRQSFSGATTDAMYSPIRTFSGGVNVTF